MVFNRRVALALAFVCLVFAAWMAVPDIAMAGTWFTTATHQGSLLAASSAPAPSSPLVSEAATEASSLALIGVAFALAGRGLKPTA